MIFGERIKVYDFTLEYSYKNVEFSNETSMAEMKPVVIEKDEFEFRSERFLVAFFEIFVF